MIDAFDVAVVAELRDLLGDDLDRVLEAFRHDAVERLQQAREAWRRHDPGTLGQQAHSLKGAAANLGARHLARTCETLEAAAMASARDGGNDLGHGDLGALLNAVADELGHCLEAFSGRPYRL
jgi:HPt (histidine-containing phosphotransfer) domain-containing protein